MIDAKEVVCRHLFTACYRSYEQRLNLVLEKHKLKQHVMQYISACFVPFGQTMCFHLHGNVIAEKGRIYSFQ